MAETLDARGLKCPLPVLKAKKAMKPLAAGDSRSFFLFSAVRAILQTALFLGGVLWFGLPGGILALCLAMLAAYPVLIALARKHNAWDGLHDLGFGLMWLAAGAAALHLHRDALPALLPAA